MEKTINERLEKLTPDLIKKSIRNYIIYKLKMHGFTLSNFAKKIGVRPQAIDNCLRSDYPRVQEEICKTIGERPEHLWPQRYNESGKGNKRRDSLKNKNTTAAEKIKAKDSRELSNFKNEGE